MRTTPGKQLGERGILAGDQPGVQLLVGVDRQAGQDAHVELWTELPHRPGRRDLPDLPTVPARAGPRGDRDEQVPRPVRDHALGEPSSPYGKVAITRGA